jgi:ABC-type Fe3+ transport system substrate-binding protein
MAINTDLVPPDQEPKTYKDLLDPRWKGKLAMDDPRGSGPGGTILSGMEVLYGIDEVDSKLAEQNIFFATQAGPILEALNRGEYAIFLSSNHTDVIAQRKAGAPIKQIKPADGVGVTPINQGLIKNAPHPNAAYAFLDFIQTPEIQAEETNYNNYGTPNDKAKPLVDPKVLADPAVFPPEETFALLEGSKDTSASTQRTDIWEEFKQKLGG